MRTTRTSKWVMLFFSVSEIFFNMFICALVGPNNVEKIDEHQDSLI